jgi:hypothetical protein
LKICVTSNEIPQEALRILSKLGDVRVNPTSGPPKRGDLFAEIHDALAAENIASALDGTRPPNLVNGDVLR